MIRSPFVLNVADLLGRDALSRPVNIDASAEWGMDMSRMSPDIPVEADLVLHPVSGGVAVTGSVRYTTIDTCSRCLDTFTTPRRATIGALFDTTEDDETYALDGHTIDVEQMLLDEVLLAVPVTQDCGDDCQGVVTSAENDLNTDPDTDGGESRSPFAALKDLLDQDLLEPGD
ncbi:MAG: DUF177 domain-containing protein [Actinomycetia bacterium]|nr:DUF177 domain-containing protein [Actinomycetes bacterium]